MRITKVEVYKVTLRYREVFRIALGASSRTTNLIVKIYTDEGMMGIGESCPSRRITHDSIETNLEALELLAPKLIGVDPTRIEYIHKLFRKVYGNPSIKAALDMAMHDIIGKAAGLPVYKLLGGFRSEIVTDITIGIKSPKEMAKAAVNLVEKGFRTLKLKVGVDPDEDVERIKAVRDSVGGDIAIRIDANQGWSVREAIDVLNKVYRYDIQLCEQPVKYNDLEGMARVKERSPIPIMADESVHDAKDAIKLVKLNAADVVNIKLMKCGGLHEAIKIASICESAGISNMIGCMGESRIAITASVHLAMALENIIYCDLDSDLLNLDEVVAEGGASIEGDVRRVPDAPGLGIKGLKEDMLVFIKRWE